MLLWASLIVFIIVNSIEVNMSENKQVSTNQIFPKWMNRLPLIILLTLGAVASCVIFIIWYWFSPKHLDVGYQPKQPIPFSHRLHVSEVGLDCRYCHGSVEEAPNANIPSSELCLNCHQHIKTESKHIQKIQESYQTNTPIEWVRVHMLPDYVYFNHSRHINSGVSCVNCHGRVDQMDTVHQVKSLSMAFCLECHRNPEEYLRPKDELLNFDWKSDNQLEQGAILRQLYDVNPREDCNTCHR